MDLAERGALSETNLPDSGSRAVFSQAVTLLLLLLAYPPLLFPFPRDLGNREGFFFFAEVKPKSSDALLTFEQPSCCEGCLQKRLLSIPLAFSPSFLDMFS